MKKETTKIINIFEKEIEQIKIQLSTDSSLTQDQRFNFLALISKTRDLINEEEQRLEEKLNADFVQLYRKNIEAIVELGKRSQLAVLIFVYLLKTIDRQNAVVISQETLCEIFEVSRMTMYRAQKELEKSNFIKIIKVGTANAYVLNSEIVWTTYANKKQFAVFSAQIIASKEEQKENKKIKTSKISYAHLDNKHYIKNKAINNLEDIKAPSHNQET